MIHNRLKRVAFYIQNGWAFGRIHNDLIKHLYRYGVDSYILDWSKAFTLEEVRELDAVTDLWCTNPHGAVMLHTTFGIPFHKISVIAHSVFDIDIIVQDIKDRVEDLFSYGAISNFLKEYSKGAGIKREPTLCNVGINTHLFRSAPPLAIRTIGFAGSYSDAPVENTVSWVNLKRGWLVNEISEKTGCRLKVAQHYHNSFVTMQGFYSSIDCLIQASVNEGGGMPLLEAGAAGNLVLTTPVGFYEEHVTELGAIELPFDDDLLVEKAVQTINHYNQHPEELIARCTGIQKHSELYDWTYVIKDWLKLF